MRIVFDTNIIYQTKKRLLDGPEMTIICSLRDKLGLDIVIPDVVRLESINLFRSFFSQEVSTILRSLRMINGLRDEQVSMPIEQTADEACANYAVRLDDRIDEIGARVVEHPAIPHSELVDRCLRGRKPFDAAGKDGYRDTLIWETVLQNVAGNDKQTILVTANSSDFAGKRGKLHQDLQDDLERHGLKSDAVILCKSLKLLIEKHVIPKKAEVDELMSAVERLEWSELADLWHGQHEKILERMRDKFPPDDQVISKLLGVRVIGARLEDLDENVFPDEENETRLIDEEKYLYSVSSACLVTVEFLADAADAFVLTQRDDIWSNDRGTDGGLNAVSAVFQIDFKMSHVLDKQTHRILEWDVDSVEYDVLGI